MSRGDTYGFDLVLIRLLLGRVTTLYTCHCMPLAGSSYHGGGSLSGVEFYDVLTSTTTTIIITTNNTNTTDTTGISTESRPLEPTFSSVLGLTGLAEMID